ncbi:M13 family metallopeptidase [Derxia gummosa]|uniref:M13 family metallopeptidase n=1 Tax=Derxia gummosa DSM 723 TaxID=1121388 RepID=A0A9U5CWD1_9BURK|nr:M13 family metallopeptidase [Derxia gummosa]
MKFAAACCITLSACMAAGCAHLPAYDAGGGAALATPPSTLGKSGPIASGIDLAWRDPAVRPADDLFRHINGKWLDTTPIPADKSAWGSFHELADRSLDQLHAILDGIDPATADADSRRVADLYASFLDEARIDRLGAAPLAPLLARIDALRDPRDLPALIGELGLAGVNGPYAFSVDQDARDSTRYLLALQQTGLGLPDRDYYLSDAPQFAAIRADYEAHIARMFTLAGQGGDAGKSGAASSGGEADAARAAGKPGAAAPTPQATDAARRILALETKLARAQWSRVERRDPVKGYNRMTVAQLAAAAPGHDWAGFLAASGVPAGINEVNAAQPSYLAAFAALAGEVPLADWRDYLRWKTLDSLAPYLARPLADASFDFHGRRVSGTPEQAARWKRGVRVVDANLGEALGKLYVARHFRPEQKARMEALVANLLATYASSIDSLDWMGDATRAEARRKLASFRPKIGYPARWRGYDGLDIRRDDLVGNLLRATRFEAARQLARLGQPVDRDEWFMNPQTVNAYYNPRMNEIVFPAAILQPPFFDANADDAANYGGIGAVIGHEISHGFDDQGSQYDGDGNLRVWWTPEDRKRYEERTAMLVEQYGAYEPVPGFHLDGRLTLGENIADNAGLSVAYRAWRRALGGIEPPVIDGMTGEQRFYAGWAQVWRGKVREAEALRRLKTDPHSPADLRCNATLSNQPGFYAAYGVQPGDRLWRAPEQRVTIW